LLSNQARLGVQSRSLVVIAQLLVLALQLLDTLTLRAAVELVGQTLAFGFYAGQFSLQCADILGLSAVLGLRRATGRLLGEGGLGQQDAAEHSAAD